MAKRKCAAPVASPTSADVQQALVTSAADLFGYIRAHASLSELMLVHEQLMQHVATMVTRRGEQAKLERETATRRSQQAVSRQQRVEVAAQQRQQALDAQRQAQMQQEQHRASLNAQRGWSPVPADDPYVDDNSARLILPQGDAHG